MTPTEFGERIAALRNEKEITQSELAEILNISTQAVSKWETGGGFPDVQIIPQLANFFGTTTDYLFGCVRKEHRIFCMNPNHGNGGGNTGRPFVPTYQKILNDGYLSKGWHVLNAQLSSEKESTSMMVVIERDS